MADQVEVNVDANTPSSVSHNSSFSFDADVSGTSSLDTCFSVSGLFLTSIMGLSQGRRSAIFFFWGGGGGGGGSSHVS